MAEQSKKIGLYGGTFDPIHNGHLMVAEWTRECLKLDKIVFIPAFIPPHKQSLTLTAPEIRCEMVSKAIATNPYFELSTYEIDKNDVSFSIETIRHFRSYYNSSKESLFFVIGADSWMEFDSWFQPEEILRSSKIVVYPRPGYTNVFIPASMQNRVVMLESPTFDVSSTLIREMVFNSRSIKYLVPNDVAQVIDRYGLYKEIS